jgi:hypothetical protein
MRIVWHGLGSEIVRRFRSHFVQVDEDRRPPLAERRDPAPRFRLGQREPVAVEVEQIVIGAPAGPGLDMLGRQRARIRLEAE